MYIYAAARWGDLKTRRTQKSLSGLYEFMYDFVSCNGYFKVAYNVKRHLKIGFHSINDGTEITTVFFAICKCDILLSLAP